MNLEKSLRGSGDSAKFLMNVQFLKPVDPTLLFDHEDFLSIVVAHVINEVNGELGKSEDRDKREEKDKWYSSIELL